MMISGRAGFSLSSFSSITFSKKDNWLDSFFSGLLPKMTNSIPITLRPFFLSAKAKARSVCFFKSF